MLTCFVVGFNIHINRASEVNMKKVIYECTSTRVPVELVSAVREAHEKRVKKNPKLRVIDIWAELIDKVQK